MRGLSAWAFLPLGLAMACLHALPAGAEPPSRIASLNLCADELVLRLADRENVATLTWLSREHAASNLAELAAGIPLNHGLAEEILPLQPDLVIAGRYTTRIAVAFLRREGLPLVELDVPRSLAEVMEQIRQIAALVGHPERGEAMIAEMQAGLDRFAPAADDWRPRAFILRPNGFAVGAGSLVDSLLEHAGLRNAAAELGLDGQSQVPLETVLLKDADLLIVDANDRHAPALATEMLRHPALLRMGRRIEILPLPTRWWTCAGPMLTKAVAHLAEAAERARQVRSATEPAEGEAGG